MTNHRRFREYNVDTTYHVARFPNQGRRCRPGMELGTGGKGLTKP